MDASEAPAIADPAQLTTIGDGQINPYETDPLVNMYCSFDYGERINCLGRPFPQFPVI